MRSRSKLDWENPVFYTDFFWREQSTCIHTQYSRLWWSTDGKECVLLTSVNLKISKSKTSYKQNNAGHKCFGSAIYYDGISGSSKVDVSMGKTQISPSDNRSYNPPPTLELHLMTSSVSSNSASSFSSSPGIDSLGCPLEVLPVQERFIYSVFTKDTLDEKGQARNTSTPVTFNALNSTKNSPVAAGWNPQLIANWIGKITFQKIRLT